MGQTNYQYGTQEIAISPTLRFTVAESREAYEVGAPAKQSKLLANESPLQLLPQLACKIGDRHATLLQQLYYLELSFQGKHDEAGYKWVRVGLEDSEDGVSWCEMMPYLGRNTIKSIVNDLIAESLMISRKFKGRSLWYRVNKIAVDSLVAPVARVTKGKERAVKIVKNKYQNLVDSNNVKNDHQNLVDQVPEFGRPSTRIWGNDYQNLDTSKTLFLDSTETNLDSKNLAPQIGAELGADLAETEFLAELQKLQATDGNDSALNSSDIQAVVTAPPCCEAPPQADKPKRVLKRAETEESATPSALNPHQAKIKAFADGLIWKIENKASLGKILKAVGELNVQYPDNTAEQISRVIAHLKQPGFKPSLNYILQEWGAVMAELAELDKHVEMITALKSLYRFESLTAKGEAELSEVAGLLLQAGRDVAWVMKFPEIWADNISDKSIKKPGYRNLIKHVHLEPKKSAESDNSDWAEGELEEWLKGTTVGA